MWHPSAQNLPTAPTSFMVKPESYNRGYMVMSPLPLISLTSFSLFLLNSSHTGILLFPTLRAHSYLCHLHFLFLPLACSSTKCPSGPLPHLLPYHVQLSSSLPGRLWLLLYFKLQPPTPNTPALFFSIEFTTLDTHILIISADCLSLPLECKLNATEI